MTGAQLALHLPHEVAELAARTHACDQGEVPVVDLLPVQLIHVLRPELISLQTPRFTVHLLPFTLGTTETLTRDRSIHPVLRGWPLPVGGFSPALITRKRGPVP